MTDIRDQLIEEMDASRTHLRTLIDEIGAQAEVYPNWQVKELLAHITGWDELLINVLNAYLENQPPVMLVDKGLDEFNARVVSQRAALSYEAVCQEWESTRENLKRLVRSIPAERFEEELVMPWGQQGKIKDFIRIFSHHEIEHEEEIRKQKQEI